MFKFWIRVGALDWGHLFGKILAFNQPEEGRKPRLGACNSAWCQSRLQQWRVSTMVEMKRMPLNATCGARNLLLSSNLGFGIQVHLLRRRFRRSWTVRITNTNLQLPTWDAKSRERLAGPSSLANSCIREIKPSEIIW